MNKHVKVVAGVLALTLVFSGGIAIGRNNISVTAPVTASAYQSYTYGDFDYTLLDGDEVMIIACDRDIKEAVIPAEIDGKPVTCIQTNAFLDRTNLESVVIPDSVKTIAYEAFEGCTNLKSVTIPDSVISISARVFQNCKSLESVTLSKNATSIGEGAFNGCEALTSITIPDSVKSIGHMAFRDCTNLSDITLPENLIRFGMMSFDGTPWLEAKKAENQIVVVNNAIIDAIDCRGDVVIPDGIVAISGSGFANARITSITLPESVTEIGDYTFYGCYYLKEITLPESVTYIGESAFADCIRFGLITIMNPDCSIYDSNRTIERGLINAPENSKAQEYAEKYDHTFIKLGETIPELPEYPEPIKKGDINEDGYIDPIDASIILSYYAYTSTTEDKPVMTLDEFMNSDLF
ncbi:MAG: leucine-rich repeat protein [Ruminococcus sp.]|nr:leucine-rich repeat protein [Ruminococcus sp.]